MTGDPLPDKRPRLGLSSIVAASLFFVVATVVMTWPMARDLRHLISDPGDPYLTTWILHWDYRSLTHHPLSLFDANIFFPSRLTLAFSENLVGAAVFGIPLFAAGMPPIEVYNVVFLLGMAISGFGAWALADELTGDAVASLLAGIAYAYVPFRFDQVAHIQMQWGGFLPLFLLFLFRFFESRKTQDLFGFAIFFILNGLANVHFAIFGTIALVLTATLELTRRDLWRDRQVLARLLATIGVSAIALGPFFLPYAIAARLYHFHRGLGEMISYSAVPGSFLSAGLRNKLLGAATTRFARPEAALYPGLVLVTLAGLGIYRGRPKRQDPAKRIDRRRVPIWLDTLVVALIVVRVALAIFGQVRIHHVISIREPYRLSMLLFLLVVARCSIAFPALVGYKDWSDLLRASSPIVSWGCVMTLAGIAVALGGRFFIYRELFEMFPFVFGAIRCPARGFVLAHLGLGLLAAGGLSSARTSGSRFGAFTWPVLVIGAVLFEYRAAPLDLYRADAEALPVTHWLAARRFPGGILELPMKLEDNLEYVYRVTQHNHPILNGYSGFFPPEFVDLQNRFAANPVAPGTMERIRKMDARLVIFHADKATTDELVSIPAFLKEEKRLGELKPAAYFHDSRDTSLVFELPSPAPVATASEAAAAEKSIDAFLANPGEAATPPYGWFDGPANGAILQGSEIRGSGWAASDSGMSEIEISLDGRVAGRATYGFPRPDVIAAKPRVPCKALCGYRYKVINVPPGKHVLSTRFVGNNGKDVTLPTAEVWMRP